MKSIKLGFLNSYFQEQELRDLQAVKNYCKEIGYEEDFENIFLPIYKKYGWEFIRDIGEITWEKINYNEYVVTYLNLDRLSCLVEYDEKKKKFVAVSF